MSQIQWVQAQLLLDTGASLCDPCDLIEPGRYCRQCGADKAPAPAYTCDTCHSQGEGPYCVACGAMLGDVLAAQIARGEFDMAQFQREMAPFLQPGFTEAEKAALRREGLPIPGEV